MCCTTQKAAQQVFSASIVAAPAEIRFVQSPDCLGTPITLPDPMAGMVKIAAPPKFICCVREQMLREHTLHQRKAGLSALRP